MHASQSFQPIASELKQGINLLEASAGTGKTYAIAMLALRFVVEKNIPIEQLLIVTFTKAATKELKARVRARLVDAKHYFLGQYDDNSIDPNIRQWAEQLTDNTGISPESAIQRLNNALLGIDQAGIFTIHGFCQRLLKEHALESGQMFDVELSDDIDSIRSQIADDFWRAQIYPRAAWEVALLCHEHTTPDSLLLSLGKLSSTLTLYPELEDLEHCLQHIQTDVQRAKNTLAKQGAALADAVHAGYFKKSLTDKFADAYQSISHWLDAMSSSETPFNNARPSDASFKLFTSEYLAKAIRVAHKEQLNFDASAFDSLAARLQKVGLVLRRTLAETLQTELDSRLQKLNIMSYDSLITRTAEALSSTTGALLINAIAQQYRVALIDEFQDTDQTQWSIFSHLFAAETQSLYLIGDPKQAIYKFRGADIHSYLAAKTQTQQHYTLTQNWRSHPHLVQAINQLFSLNKNPFIFANLAFNSVDPALSAEQGQLLQHKQTLAPLALWQLAESDANTGYWTAGKAAEQLKIATINEILQLLQGASLIQKETSTQPVKPADIAILVRTNTQAKLYQDGLKEAGIPAVLNSTDSVFKSPEATVLYKLMQALAQPADMHLCKQALSLPWFALDGQQLQHTLNNEVQLGAWLNRFQDYHELWQKKGFMAMMLRLLSRENVRAHLSHSRHAERQITNLQHLLELVQQASLDEHLGLHKTIDWLRTAISTENASDEQQLRLETDADAVKIVTMHRAKGLEYPIVFCPYLWYRHDRLSGEKNLINCYANGEMIADLGSADFEQHRDIALAEELAEDLRILYVALTRAKYRCYLTWVNARPATKPNRSALAHLLSAHLDFASMDFNEQQSVLEQLAIDFPDKFSYQLLSAENTLQGQYQSTKSATELSVLAHTRHLYSNWQMSSYTALSYLSLHEAHELPIDKAQEANESRPTNTEPLALPKGTHTGNVIHDLLENISFNKLAQRLDISEQRDTSCQRYGLKVAQPEVIDELLYHTVCTPLAMDDHNFYLANIPEAACLKEMPFYLKLSEFATEQINVVLKDIPTFQALSSKQIQGYLTGFIDLIFVYQGKYYLLDYKTNHLDNDLSENLTLAMQEHNYGLQYWIYSVVLHLYLQKRLPDYQFSEHFGGIRYLFVRAMQREQAMSGVFSTKPDHQRLKKLSELFLG